MNFCVGGMVEVQINETPATSVMEFHAEDEKDRSAAASSSSSTVSSPSFLTRTSAKNASSDPETPSTRRTTPRTSARTARSTPKSSQNHRSSTARTPTIQTESSSGSNIKMLQGSPSPRMLNPLSPNTSRMAQSKRRVPNFHNLKTLDALLKRLESGFRVKIHDGANKEGRNVYLQLLQDRTYFLIRSVEASQDWKNIKFPVRKILRLEVGKNKSSVLCTEMYEDIFHLTCFSIVVQLYSDNETTFDFETPSIIEREALVSTLMVVLDQTHNTRQALTMMEDLSESSNVRQQLQEQVCHKGTKIHVFHDDQADQEGTEITLVYNKSESENSLQQRDQNRPEDSTPLEHDHLPKSPPRLSKKVFSRRSPNYSFTPIEFEDNDNEHDDSVQNESRDSQSWTEQVITEKYGGDENDEREVTNFEIVPAPLPPVPTAAGSAVAAECSDPKADSFQANPNNQVAWCSDDICTLALKDIAETTLGIFDPSKTKETASSSTAAERVYVEEYIAGVLGAPKTALGVFFKDGDVWNVANNNAPDETAPRMKNRATFLNAQAMRLRALRNEMTFAAALKRSKEKMQFVQTTQSFDDAAHLLDAQEKGFNRLHNSALLEKVVGSMVIKESPSNETAYYDSDPEDVRPRTRGVRRKSAQHENSRSEDKKQEKQRHALSGIGFEHISLGKKLKKVDEGLIIQIVQAMRNETLTLMWHPTQSKEQPNRSPVCVNLWIESGVYLVDGSFLLPRLSWNLAYEKNLESKKLNVSNLEPEQVDLLDVCRIRATEKIDRRLHPFPDPRCSFIIETQDDVFLFETQNSEERERVVYGLKLVIARLASLLMLRDIRAVEEFFGSTTMGPGLAPQWARGR